MQQNEGRHRVTLFVNLPSLLRDMGTDPGTVLASAGLPSDALDDPAANITYLAAARLLQASVVQTGCEHFGLLLGSRARIACFGAMGELMRSAPDLGTALLEFVGNQQWNWDDAVVYLLAYGATSILGYAAYDANVPGLGQVADVSAAIGCTFLRELAGAVPDEILLARRRPNDPEPYSRLLPCRVRFDAEQTALVFPCRLLSRPIPTADPGRRRTLQQQVARFSEMSDPGTRAQLLRVLRSRIVSGIPRVEDAATLLSVHPRTLHRRLHEEGTSFQRVLKEARFAVARQLLSGTRLDLTQIALALGYADLTVFSRAFRTWAGVPPSHWRAHAGSMT